MPASSPASLSGLPTLALTSTYTGGRIAIPVSAPLACPAPLVVNGSIITGTNPQMSGRLIRNGVPSNCGIPYTCSGVQNTSTPFSYEVFDFINPSSDWQCLDVKLDARACTQQLYSAAYLNGFNAGDLCENIQGAMGFSTSDVYGYSFLAPPGADFTIINNTIGIMPPGSDCANYTMTVTLCSATPDIAVTRGAGLPLIQADAAGKALVPVPVVFNNRGDFTGSVSAATVSETVIVSVLDGQPAAVQASFGKAGAIVGPGASVVQTVPLKFSGSQFQCLPRTYQVDSVLGMTSGIYHCNGTNPPSAAVMAGSILRDAAFIEDSHAFESRPGAHITVTVDTLSAATAFDIRACISDRPSGPCLSGFEANDTFNCTFAPPGCGSVYMATLVR